MKMTPRDFKGLAGIMPTPATSDAESWRCENSVNLSESERMAGLLVEAGVDILMTNGTFGECATLTRTEHEAFNACIAETIAGRVPFFCGVGTLNTRDTIAQARRAIALGADGIFVGRPMWLAMSQSQILRFHQDLAEALPGVPQVIYDNPIAFKGKIEPETYIELARIPEVIAAKHVGGPSLESDALAVGDACRILPVNGDWARVARAHPDLFEACWSGHVACAPAPLVALASAIAARDWDRADSISARCRWAEQAMMAGGDLATFMNHSIAIGHLRFEAAGLIDPGPVRPPYAGLPDAYREGALETGRRWAVIQKEFAAEMPA